MFGQYKNIIIVVLIIVGIFFAYYFTKQNTTDTGSSLLVSGQQSVDVLGQDIIRVLNRIKSIDLDRSVFDDPVYKNLTDHSRSIQDQPVGRENIFSPYQKTSAAAAPATETGSKK